MQRRRLNREWSDAFEVEGRRPRRLAGSGRGDDEEDRAAQPFWARPFR